MTWLWWAPLVASGLHIGEEFVYPGGFAAWDRAYRPSIRESITPGLHIVVNALLLIAGFIVGAAGLPGGVLEAGGIRFRSAIPPALAVPGWLALAALLFSNAVFHIVGTYRTKQVSPGVRTGVLLYIPMAIGGYGYFLITRQVSPAAATASALVGGSYHLWAAIMHRLRSSKSPGA